jgi:hypothetical protein
MDSGTLVCQNRLPRLLREDNRSQDDRIKLRMAADIGPVKQGDLGFGGPTAIRCPTP